MSTLKSASESLRPYRTVMLLLANALECDALALWCNHRLECEAQWETDLEKGLARCREMKPSLLAVDPWLCSGAIEQTIVLLRQEFIGHLLVLDRRPVDARLAEILHEPSASYVSRTSSPDAMAAAFTDILQHGRRAFDPSLASRIRSTKQGYALDRCPNGSALSQLSQRELQVMTILAEGSSVRKCAAALHLTESTIDNHKSRIMKKLKVHKASELTVLAIRYGLIEV